MFCDCPLTFADNEESCAVDDEMKAALEIQSVMSPRCTRARSYSAQLLTRYFVLYLGWTLEFMQRRWPIGQKGPPRSEESANRLYDSRTNAGI